MAAVSCLLDTDPVGDVLREGETVFVDAVVGGKLFLGSEWSGEASVDATPAEVVPTPTPTPASHRAPTPTPTTARATDDEDEDDEDEEQAASDDDEDAGEEDEDDPPVRRSAKSGPLDGDFEDDRPFRRNTPAQTNKASAAHDDDDDDEKDFGRGSPGKQGGAALSHDEAMLYALIAATNLMNSGRTKEVRAHDPLCVDLPVLVAVLVSRSLPLRSGWCICVVSSGWLVRVWLSRQAIEAYNAMLAVDSTNPGALVGLGTIKALAGDVRDEAGEGCAGEAVSIHRRWCPR